MLLLGADRVKDAAILLARLLLVILFLIFGWGKLTHFGATVGYFTHTGVPVPGLATLIAIIMEFLVGILLLLGILTRPLALLLALYTLGTALIGHPYWTMTGGARVGAEINFYKNVSIIGGLILLYVTGPGKYALGSKFDLD